MGTIATWKAVHNYRILPTCNVGKHCRNCLWAHYDTLPGNRGGRQSGWRCYKGDIWVSLPGVCGLWAAK